MIRTLLALILAATAHAAQGSMAQCVELPYPGMPKQLWDRELVWMKNIGVNCVALPDSPNLPSDLPSVLSTVRKLELPAWVLAERASPALLASLESMTEAHGGTVRWIGRDAAPQPVYRVSATDPQALALARGYLEKQTGTILWTDVETTLSPALHRGAINFAGEEQPTVAALRRELALMYQWQPLIGDLSADHPVRGVNAKLPDSLSTHQLTSPAGVSAISIVNRGSAEYRGELQVFYPPAKQAIKLPETVVPAGDALWLPINVPLSSLHLGNSETIVYSTVELNRMEYENGILAMEFAAPSGGEIVLHLAAEPAGPYLGAGKPRTFEWDAASGRVRLPIPAGTGSTHRVRIGLVLHAPDISAFFGDRKVLTIGQRNTIVTSYSSEEVAQHSRLMGPAWLKAEAVVKSSLEIEYSFTVPPSALHGSHAEFTLEADGAQMSHLRVQLLRPASLRIREAVTRHLGAGFDLPLDPPLIPIDQKAGRELSITIRNNSQEIRTFTVQASGGDLEFAQPKTEVVVAGSSERDISVRVFAETASPGLHTATLKLSGGAESETPIRILVIPRGETVRYTEDEATILESQQARAVFTKDRWTEFIWKDSERNMLPEGGLPLAGAQPVDLHAAELTLEGTSVPLKAGKQGDTILTVTQALNNRTVYRLSR